MNRKRWRATLAAVLVGVAGILLSLRPSQSQVQIQKVRIDDTMREPIALRVNLTLTAGTFTSRNIYTVPTGKVLVIEFASIQGTSSLEAVLLTGKINGGEFSHLLGQINTTVPTYQNLTKIYVGPEENLIAFFSHPNSQAQHNIAFSLSGYLADALPPGASAFRTDVNRDGLTSVQDAIAVLRRVVGLG